MKPLYSMLKVGNYWFIIYHMNYKEKFGITESIYNLCLLFRSKRLGIVGMQTNNILILTNNNFASTEKETIKSAKIITKDREYLTSSYLSKFYGTQITLDSSRHSFDKRKLC